MTAATLDARGIVTACPSCRQKNRQPYDSLGSATRCGRCQAELGPPAAPVHAEHEGQFDELVRASAVPVLVDFWAPWCGPCRMVAPELDRVAAAEAGRLLVVKVNTEELPSVGARFGVRSIPTMAVFQDGAEVGRDVGAKPAAAIRAFVAQVVRRS